MNSFCLTCGNSHREARKADQGGLTGKASALTLYHGVWSAQVGGSQGKAVTGKSNGSWFQSPEAWFASFTSKA